MLTSMDETRSPARRRRGDATAFRAGLVALALAAAALVAFLPVPLPDTASGLGATNVAPVNDWTSVGHTFRTDMDGLCRVDVALSTLKAAEGVDVQFYVRGGGPEGPNLRTVRRKLSDLPEGKALDLYNTRWRDLPWACFSFEPLYGYAGRQLYFNLEGKNVPRESTVEVLVAYPNSYERGEAYVTEKPAGGTVVFRTFAMGTPAGLLGLTSERLAEGRSGLLGAAWFYSLLAVALLVAGVWLFVGIVRLGRQEGHQ